MNFFSFFYIEVWVMGVMGVIGIIGIIGIGLVEIRLIVIGLERSQKV